MQSAAVMDRLVGVSVTWRVALRQIIKIARFTSNRVCSVKGSRRIYEKSSTANLAVFIDAVNLNHRFGGPSGSFREHPRPEESAWPTSPSRT